MKTAVDLRFAGDWSVWITLLVAVALGFAAWRFYQREVHGVLPVLRAVAVFLLVLMIAGPVLHFRRTFGEMARVFMFVDASKSMSVTDEHSENATRWQRLDTALLQSEKALLPELVTKHQVEVWTLTGERLWAAHQGIELPKALPVKPDAAATDFATSISARLGQKQESRAAVVLFTDGQQNAGSSPLELAKIAGNRGIPVFTVGYGSLERPPDLAIVSVDAPQSAHFEDRVKGTLTLKDDMQPGQTYNVRVTDDGGRMLWEKQLTTERSHRRTVAFDFSIKEVVEAKRQAAGDVEYTSLPLTMKVSIDPLPGEKDKGNNEDAFHVRAITSRRKLLLLDGRPRWETRYLRNLFERDPQWEVNTLLAGTGSAQWRRGQKPGTFPEDRDTLFSYDLIVYGEVPNDLLFSEELEWIRAFVGERGGGLVFIDGQRGALRDYAGTPLAKLFPIEWTADRLDARPSFLHVTEEGAFLGPLSLVSDGAQNAALWRSFPPPHWIASTRALPGAETLAVAVVGERRMPALVLRRFGAGKVLYAGLDESWRWRYDVADKYQGPFWNQMANWIMEPAFAVHDKYIALDAGPLNYRSGDAAEVRVRVRDDQGRPVVRASAEANLYRDGQKVGGIALKPDANFPGLYRGKTETLGPGDYEVGFDTPTLPREEKQSRAQFFVRAGDEGETGEMAELTCNEELLKQMARASGGEYFHEEEAGKLADRLEPLSHGRIEESETVLWQSWWWFAPVIALFTAEWILRKRQGLI